MPKKAIDYSKCVFYRLVCRDVTVTEVYVGHTTSEVDRRATHKSHCTNEKSKKYNYFVYKFIREHGGWDNWQLIVHEKIAVKDIYEAVLRERFWTEHYQAKLNSNVPGRTRAEYDAAHVEEKKAAAAAYYVAHVDEIKTANASYRAAHVDEIKAYQAANAAHKKEKHTCACGGKYTTHNRGIHIKSKKHIAFAAN